MGGGNAAAAAFWGHVVRQRTNLRPIHVRSTPQPKTCRVIHVSTHLHSCIENGNDEKHPSWSLFHPCTCTYTTRAVACALKPGLGLQNRTHQHHHRCLAILEGIHCKRIAGEDGSEMRLRYMYSSCSRPRDIMHRFLLPSDDALLRRAPPPPHPLGAPRTCWMSGCSERQDPSVSAS